MNEIILQNKGGKILPSSRDVAEKFGKNHKEILRSISNISKEISTAQFCALFKLSNYKASNGKTNKEYLMDRGVAEMETPSGKQNMTIINESGLYALIFGSKLESAKRS